MNVVYIWREFVSFYGYVHWRMTTEISVMYGSEKVNSYIEQVRSSPYLGVSSDHILNDQITTIYNKANILTRSPASF